MHGLLSKGILLYSLSVPGRPANLDGAIALLETGKWGKKWRVIIILKLKIARENHFEAIMFHMKTNGGKVLTHVYNLLINATALHGLCCVTISGD